jgi:membrane fusion protein, multidrug efflux system
LGRRCRSTAVLLFVSMAALMAAAACSRGAGPEEEGSEAIVPTITADTAVVSRVSIADDLVVRGTITALPNEDVRVSALIAGRVDAVTVAEGDAVTSGQIVARINARNLQDQRRQTLAASQQAAAQLENARLNLQRNEQLFTRGVAAGKEVEDARMAVAQAEAALEQASAAADTISLQIERAEVRSPITGQVVKRMVSVGEQVDGTAASPIIEIANLDRVELAASLPAEQLPLVSVGQSVTVSTDTYADRTFNGTVVAIAPSVDPATNASLVRIRVENAGRLLKVGMFAQARVRLSVHPDALVVPSSALVRDEQGAAVYVVSGDTARRTTVTTGLEQDGTVELLSGAAEQQVILTSGVHGLGESVKVAKKE